MPIDVIMPPLSQTMDVVILAKWLKAVGQPVAKGEPLFSIETDKATLEIESPGTGVLQQILAPEKSEVAVRSRVAVLALPGETPLAPAAVSTGTSTLAAQPTAALIAGASVDRRDLPPGRRERILASPRARRLAAGEGVALAGLTPSGPQGMIVERDVRAFLATRSEASSDAEPVASGGQFASENANSALARRATPEWPQRADTATFLREADVGELLRLREQIVAATPAAARLTHSDLLLSIVGRQLKVHTLLNAVVDGENVTLSQAIHIAIVVEAGRGLLRPVLRDADRKRPLEIARERERLAQRAQAGQLGADELSRGTFTLADLGELGIDAFTPGITPAQVAVLGVGRIRPAQAGGRQVMTLALTVDRRFVDDAPAACFLADVAEWIENPYRML